MSENFKEYWAHRNSAKVPFDSPFRNQEDRHLMTFLHGLKRGYDLAKKDAETLEKLRNTTVVFIPNEAAGVGSPQIKDCDILKPNLDDCRKETL